MRYTNKLGVALNKINLNVFDMRAYAEALLAFKEVRDLEPGQGIALRDAVMAYAKHLNESPSIVYTVEELDQLPDGSIVKDSEGEVYIMTPYDEFWRVWGNDKRFSTGEIVLPARVLDTP